MRARSLFGLAAALAALVAGAVPSASTAVTTKVYDHNISGNVLNDGDTGVANGVVLSANNYGADFVTLQEVCRSQYNFIESSQGFAGYYEPTVTPEEYAPRVLCGGKSDYGIAVFSRGGIGTIYKEKYALPYNGLMVCIRQNIRDTTMRARACSVHLDTDATKRQAQLDDVAYVVNTQAASGTRVIVAGDFNDTPDHLEELGNRFIEADYINNEWTHENRSCPYAVDTAARDQYCQGRYTRKIDHIFYSRNHVISFSVSGAPAGTYYSDHLRLQGTAGFD